MASASLKDPLTVSYPRTLLSIVASVGGLALFFVMASSFLVSRPIGDKITEYFYGVDDAQKIDLVTSVNESELDSWVTNNVVPNVRTSSSTMIDKNETEASVGSSEKPNGERDTEGPATGMTSQTPEPLDTNQNSDLKRDVDVKTSSRASSTILYKNGTESSLDSTKKSDGEVDAERPATGKKSQAPESLDTNQFSDRSPENVDVKSSPLAATDISEAHIVHKNESHIPSSDSSTEVVAPSVATNKIEVNSIDSECDLYHGKWVYNSAGPLYRNYSCPVISERQNCQRNGRPDKDYEYWRWKPTQCDLPRFDARKFLELMRGKRLAFIGDSVARNQMESMLCMLWQVEVPINRGNKRMQRYLFRSTSTMIIRIWSSWLVHSTNQPFDFAPAGVNKLHLDAPDESFMEFVTGFDVIVLSCGHWFAKQSVYILKNEIVGGQLWWPDNSKQMKFNNIEAFGIAMETALTALATHPNYTGMTILRSFSPDHYEGGTWNTGGSCTGKVTPATDDELVENGFTNIMHDKQLIGFNHAINNRTNKSKLKFMDITNAFQYRHDGHPGPYRNSDPNKITTRGPDGRPPPQDCLHWCMPGPVDTWNELVAEIVRRELQGRKNPS